MISAPSSSFEPLPKRFALGSTTGTSSSAAQTASNDLEGQVMLQIMRLIQAYGIGEERGQASGTLSVAA